MKKIMIMFLASFLCIPFVSCAYETIEVKNGGSIEGTVEFVGATIPKDEPAVTTDSEYCGKSLPTERYVINPERKVKGAFVIRDIPPGTYSVEAWHEALGKVRLANVTVESGETSRI